MFDFQHPFIRLGDDLRGIAYNIDPKYVFEDAPPPFMANGAAGLDKLRKTLGITLGYIGDAEAACAKHPCDLSSEALPLLVKVERMLSGIEFALGRIGDDSPEDKIDSWIREQITDLKSKCYDQLIGVGDRLHAEGLKSATSVTLGSGITCAVAEKLTGIGRGSIHKGTDKNSDGSLNLESLLAFVEEFRKRNPTKVKGFYCTQCKRAFAADVKPAECRHCGRPDRAGGQFVAISM